MSSASNSSTSLLPETVHDVWLSQRMELESELFDGWAATGTLPTMSTRKSDATAANSSHRTAAVTSAKVTSGSSPVAPTKVTSSANAVRGDSRNRLPVSQNTMTTPLPFSPQRVNSDAQHDASLRHRLAQQKQLEAEMARQREMFHQELTQQRQAFERELADRDSAWTTQRDQEWAALRQAKQLHELATQQLQQEMAEQRVREREEFLAWRRQVEVELAEARRLFEQERLQLQQEFTRQRDDELARLRLEREELDARLRTAHAELAHTRQQQEQDLKRRHESQEQQLQFERQELESIRESWLEKVRREQVVLENGMRFFEEHLSRVSEELRTAQRGLQAVAASASEAIPTHVMPSVESASPLSSFDDSVATQALPEANVVADEAASQPSLAEEPAKPLLSLEEIRERLQQLKSTTRQAAAV